MVEFVGRARELRVLNDVLERVGSDVGASRAGRCLLMRGRRRIGKSSLVEEFVRRTAAPSVYFTASGASEAAELTEFVDTLRASSLPDREQFDGTSPGNWTTALRLLAAALPDDRPSVVIMDEVPYLMERVDAFEGILQRAWDRELSRKPVLLILIGSDISMMEALSSYGRPFHQRGQEMIVGPLNPAEVGDMLGLDGADAIDAALVTGGLPLICASWRRGEGLWRFLERELRDPVSPLLVSAERSLAAEFPDHAYARAVLGAIGSGERTFSNIQQAAGGIANSTLTRATELLADKRLVAAELPLSTHPSKERRYRVTDPYLRFWLAFIGPHFAEIERMRGDLVLARVRAGWTSWRGRAVEPPVREAVARLLPDGAIPSAHAVGAYWTRSNDVEVDIIGADRGPVARKLLFAGSIKWLDTQPFGRRELHALVAAARSVPGWDDGLPLVAVSRAGFDDDLSLGAAWGPDELLAAWSR